MRLLLIIFLASNSLLLFGQDTSYYETPQVFTQKDSIITYSDEYDKVYYTHYLKPKQTLYSIAHHFGLDLFSLYDYNPRLRTKVAQVGDEIRVPIPTQKVIPLDKRSADMIPVLYKIKPKDNIFRISRVMFDMEQSQLIRYNKLSTLGLNIGDTLSIGWWDLRGTISDTSTTEPTPLAKSFVNLRDEFQYQSQTDKIVTRKGMVTWNKSEGQQSGFYVIHKYAKPGTVIEMTNPMYNRTAYAKVIANLPNKSYPESVLAVLSPSLANYLGVLDVRFFLKMRYLQK